MLPAQMSFAPRSFRQLAGSVVLVGRPTASNLTIFSSRCASRSDRSMAQAGREQWREPLLIGELGHESAAFGGCVKTHFARRVGSLTGEFGVTSRRKLPLRG